MRYLLVASTAAEIAESCFENGINLPGNCAAGHFQENDLLSVLVTGIGQMQCAYWLGSILAKSAYRAVINAGLAGSFDPSLTPPSVVRVREEILADLGCEGNEGPLDLFEMGLCAKNDAPFQDAVLHPLDPGFATHLLNDLPAVRSVTVNRVLSLQSSIDSIKRKWSPQIVNMEGAAVFYCCRLKGIPAIQIRAVSDMVGPRDKSKWRIEEATKSLNLRVSAILSKLDE